MLGGPWATPVAMGPFRATWLRRTDLTACARGNSPVRFAPSDGAEITSHSTCTPAASITCRAASATSGPIPSPGNNVILRVMYRNILSESQDFVETGGPTTIGQTRQEGNSAARSNSATEQRAHGAVLQPLQGKAFSQRLKVGCE